jgi:hypothetical protein
LLLVKVGNVLPEQVIVVERLVHGIIVGGGDYFTFTGGRGRGAGRGRSGVRWREGMGR